MRVADAVPLISLARGFDMRKSVNSSMASKTWLFPR